MSRKDAENAKKQVQLKSNIKKQNKFFFLISLAF